MNRQARTSRFLLPTLVALALLGAAALRLVPAAAQTAAAGPFADDNLVAWCIVPFDAKRRGPAERARMVRELGFSKVAYDWRDEHVATFEEEILQYRERKIEYFAFWGLHEKAFELFSKYDLHPQIWLMPPNPTEATQEARVAAAVKGLLPAVERTRRAGCKLGLYNHGGWGGEPENLVAVCRALREQHDAAHVGIVYNLHHGHDHLDRFPAALAAMKPYLWCLNLNGMDPQGDRVGRKILPLGAGSLDAKLLKIIRDSGYTGPIGIIGHTQDDVEQRLRDNLDGLHWLLPQLTGGQPGPPPKYRTPIPAAAPPAPAPPPAPPAAQSLKLAPGRFGQSLDAHVAGTLFSTRGDHRLAPLTVDLWVKLSRREGFNILVASESKASSTHWELYSYAGSGVLSVYLPGRGGEYRSDFNIVDDRWHFVTMTLDADRLQLFVDAQRVLDQPLPPAPAVDTADAKKAVETLAGLGRLVEGGLGCAGWLDEVRFRRGLHVPSDVPKAASPVDDATVGLWRFDALADPTSSPDDSPRKTPARLTLGAAKPTPPAAKPKVPEHWGKGQVGFEGWEDDWVDKRWQNAEVGEWLGAIVALPQGPYRKALNIRVGDERQATVLFDTQYLSLRAAWQGFLEFNPTRFGIISPPKPTGEVLFTMPEQPGWNSEKLEFLGMHVQGRRVLVRYRVDGVEVRESPWCESTPEAGQAFVRVLEVAASDRPLECLLVDMPLSAGMRPELTLVRERPLGEIVEATTGGRRRATLKIPADSLPRRYVVVYAANRLSAEHRLVQPIAARFRSLEELAQPGPPRWPEQLATTGRRGADDGPYVVDTFGVPFENPYRALMFTSGHDFTSDGDLLVSTVHGDVWRVHPEPEEAASGSSGPLRATWRRIATGLHQPLGLVVRRRADGDAVFVLGRDQITRLHDRNRDGEIDYYECFSNAYPTSAGGHDYITCLEEDSQGGFFFVHANLGVVRVAPDGKSFEAVSTGLRNPNGMGLGPGDLVTAAPQEGEWTPASAIYVARPGAYFGYGGPRVAPNRPLGYDPPVVWIPRRVDNSSGGQTWVTSDRWGPVVGHPLHLSFGQCSLMLVGGDKPGGDIRDPAAACLTEFPFRFDSGAMRGRFSPHDGQLYVTGLRGWTSAASVDGCLQRVRYTGRPAHLPVAVTPYANGVALAFSDPLDKDSAEQPGNYHLEQWNYKYSQSYGSPEYRASDPQQEGRDEVRVRSATLLDPRTVFLELKQVQPVHVLAISYALQDDAGRSLRRTTYASIHRASSQRIEEARLVRGRGGEEGDDQEWSSGLIARYESSSLRDVRMDRMAALSVGTGEPSTTFLPPGDFRVRWEGAVRLPLPTTASFRFEGAGEARLWINDRPVIGGEQWAAAASGVSRPTTLQGGLNKVVLEYRSPPGGAGRFRWLWESDEFALEPVPPTLLVARSDDAELAAGRQMRRGRELFATLRCAACHAAADAESADDLRYEAPRLAGAGRWNADWIARWIADPSHVRPGARMPRVGVTDAEARDLAAWLATLKSAPLKPALLKPVEGKAASAAAVAPVESLVKMGENLFEDLGCLACHTATRETHDAFDRTSLTHVRAKYTNDGLREYLQTPHRLHPTSRMPDFRLNEEEANALAAYLVAKGEEPRAPREAGSPERGAKWFVERGCASCHAAGDRPATGPESPRPLVDMASPRGCVAREPHGRAGVPWFELTPADRAALVRFAASDRESLGRSAPAEVARSLHQSLRCSACHDRDAQRSPRGRILVEEGERGVAPESLPNLTWTGEKLQAGWVADFLKGGRRESPLRPWLKGRMPQFPEYAAALAHGMAAEHAVAGDDERAPTTEKPADASRVALGRELIQRSALDCRQCHAVGQLPAQGDDQTKIAPGINFAIVRERVRHDYYQRFTLDPPRFDVTTKMPKLAPDGKTTKVQHILDGDARRQFEAIWQYLQHGIETP
ncbi:MAG: c-type cytochrome [Pirellulales bacterium]